MALTEKLGNIADAIRGKTGKTDAMTLDQMVTEIEGISSGGGGAISGDGWTSGVPYELTIKENTYISRDDGAERMYNGYYATDFIPCHGVTALIHSVIPTAQSTTEYGFYDADYVWIGRPQYYQYSGVVLGVPENAYYYRTSGRNVNVLSIVPIAL